MLMDWPMLWCGMNLETNDNRRLEKNEEKREIGHFEGVTPSTVSGDREGGSLVRPYIYGKVETPQGLEDQACLNPNPS